MALDFLKVKQADAVVVRAPELRQQVIEILRAVKVQQRDAEVTADILLESDLRGVDSHGSGNVVGYATRIQKGLTKAQGNVRILQESPSSALLTNDWGLGFVGAHTAMTIAMEKASQTGMGAVTVRDGTHIGMLTYYPLMCVKRDMIGLAMTNGAPCARPAGGAKAMMGTNPIAFGAPAGEEPPFLYDAATSVVAMGKIAIARRLGVPLPPGWAADREGDWVKEPPAGRGDNWSLAPLGGDRIRGAHKGYGLSVMVDILCGVLSGGGYSALCREGDNHTFMLAMDIGKFREIDEFKSMMDAMIRALHATPAEPGTDKVLVAGDPEHEIYKERSANGIPLHKSIVASMRSKAAELGVPALI
ncbi:MAG: Ldh family oxidoreductase [Chloroflexi bacterium]|nr:Ldh family oxidoreductase [Chloroflexota bacterium]